MNRLRSLESCDREFAFHWRHGCLYCVRLFCVCGVLCLGRRPATGWSHVQGVRPCIGSRNWKSSQGPTKGCRTIIIIIIIIDLKTVWQDSLDGWSARRKAVIYTGQQKRRHACLELDSKPWSQWLSERRDFMAYIAGSLWLIYLQSRSIIIRFRSTERDRCRELCLQGVRTIKRLNGVQVILLYKKGKYFSELCHRRKFLLHVQT
jgi:hypothetical protein